MITPTTGTTRVEVNDMPFVATLISLPTRAKLIVGLAVAVAALLIAGVPLSTFVPFAGLAGCLGMHLFMGHRHGDGLSATDEPPHARDA